MKGKLQQQNENTRRHLIKGVIWMLLPFVQFQIGMVQRTKRTLEQDTFVIIPNNNFRTNSKACWKCSINKSFFLLSIKSIQMRSKSIHPYLIWKILRNFEFIPKFFIWSSKTKQQKKNDEVYYGSHQWSANNSLTHSVSYLKIDIIYKCKRSNFFYDFLSHSGFLSEFSMVVGFFYLDTCV